MRPLLLLTALALTLAACDSDGGEPDGALYRTPGVDQAAGAALVGADVVVTGLARGRIGAGDFTVGQPLVWRVRPDGGGGPATVYDDVPFGQALAAVADGDGLAVLVEEQDEVPGGTTLPTLTLYRAGADGARRQPLYRAADTFGARQPLRRTPDGGFVLTVSGPGDDVVRLGPDGAVLWTYTPADAQFTVGTAPAPDGGHFVLSVLDTGRPGLSRLDADGREAWAQTFGDRGLLAVYAVEPWRDGVAVLGETDAPAVGASRAVLIRTEGRGIAIGGSEVATGRLAPSGYALAALPGGGFAVAFSDVPDDRPFTPPSAVTRARARRRGRRGPGRSASGARPRGWPRSSGWPTGAWWPSGRWVTCSPGTAATTPTCSP